MERILCGVCGWKLPYNVGRCRQCSNDAEFERIETTEPPIVVEKTCKDYWSIIHTPTAHLIRGGYGLKREAQAVADALVPLGDWTFTDPKGFTEELREKSLAALNA